MYLYRAVDVFVGWQSRVGGGWICQSYGRDLHPNELQMGSRRPHLSSSQICHFQFFICQFHLILGFLPLLDSWSNNIFQAILVIWSNLDSLGYCIRYSNRKMVLTVLYFNQNLFWSTYLIFGPIENTINLEFHGNGDICFVC